MSKTPNGAVIYRGPSQLDGEPIVVIATGLSSKSSNVKTGGGLIQTWILREDVSPTEAVNTGADASICGACPHRGEVVDGKNVNRSCYVAVWQAPLNVWKSYHRGIYPTIAKSDLPGLFAGRLVRLGAYGDPAAAPFGVWEAALSQSAGGTGYSHQWRDFPELSAYVMASADSAEDRAAAKLLGFRTFRVKAAGDPVLQGEIVCPASAEMGHKTTCDACKACGGHAAKAKADVVITVHGSADKINAHTRRTAA
jgi:hypothetical protein